MKNTILMISVLLAGLVLLAGCEGNENLSGEASAVANKYYICHATGSASNPYIGPIEIPGIQFTDPKRNGHYYHDNDYIIDKLITECPKTVPACGDGILDPDEECDGAALGSCSECNNACRCVNHPKKECANVSVILTLTNAQNVYPYGNMARTLYLGNTKAAGTNGVFRIPLTGANKKLIIDSAIKENAPGVSVQRLNENTIRFLDYGSMNKGKESVFWRIRINKGTFTGWANDFGTATIGGKRNPLERPTDGVWIYTPGQDELIFSPSEVIVKQTTAPANDGFYLYWTCS